MTRFSSSETWPRLSIHRGDSFTVSWRLSIPKILYCKETLVLVQSKNRQEMEIELMCWLTDNHAGDHESPVEDKTREQIILRWNYV